MELRDRGKFASGGAVDQHVYVTMGKPDDSGTAEEDKVTEARIAKAIELASKASSLDPHTIVASLHATFPFAYKHNPAVHAPLDHPGYFNKFGGAWYSTKYTIEGGECQAICRAIIGILKHIGCPGKAVSVVVYAEEGTGGGTIAIEALHTTKGTGAGLAFKKKAGHPTWEEALVGPSLGPSDIGKTAPPLNSFEAAVKFTHGGKTRYHVGGMGTLGAGKASSWMHRARSQARFTRFYMRSGLVASMLRASQSSHTP